VTELLSELKDACRRASSPSADEAIARGESTWLRGLPAKAEAGTIALAMGRDATVVVREDEIRAVRKDGEHYLVEVGAEASVLLRIEKAVKATVERGCGCSHHHPGARPGRRGGRRPGPIIDVEIGPVQCLLCADVVIDNGKQSVLTRICLPVPCQVDE
jgi:hypothetical protein